VSWSLVFSKQALKDAKKLKRAGLKDQANRQLEILKQNPYQNPPPYEKLLGEFTDLYSRRINIHHRLVYQVVEEEKTIKILRMWTHYK
jgi:toxin YoeB